MPLISKAFGDIITFTRASTGSYFDSAGVLQSAAINAPRLDYNPSTLAAQGLLIEEQRTNSFQRSEEFNDAYWTKGNSSITANAATSPSGTLTGDKLVEDTNNNTHRVAATNISVTSGTAYTLSLFVKAAERSAIQLSFGSDASAFPSTQSIFSLVGAGSFTTVSGTPNAVITSVGNGWYRCTISATASATTALAVIRFFLCNGTTIGSDTYLGDGTSGLFIWGAQLEVGAFPTSYIPTTTAAVTRSADVASVNTLSPWYNATEGTLFAEYKIPFNLATATNATITAFVGATGTTTNGIACYINQPTGVQGSFNVWVTGAPVGRIDATTAFVAGANIKYAAAYAANTRAVTSSGATPVTSATAYTPPAINSVSLGWDPIGSLNGYLRRITYYPRRLTNAELQAITA